MLCDSLLGERQFNLELLTIWLTRYLPNLELIPCQVSDPIHGRFSVVISEEARQLTRKKVLVGLASYCTLSGLKAQQLMMPEADNSLRIIEAQKITNQVVAIYRYLIDAYTTDFLFVPLLKHLNAVGSDQSKQIVVLKILPAFNRLMRGLAPLLKGLKKIAKASKQLRTIGFLTTQIHLSRQRILNRLSLYERIWLAPYFQLAEELLCIPWQRVCEAASQYSPHSSVAAVVTKMLPMTDAIAMAVYQRVLRVYPRHTSRQGHIQSVAVQTSMIRDLNKFQLYIWLSLLENNLSVIRRELLPLSVLVLPCSDVCWQLVQHCIQWLGEEIHPYLTPHETLMVSSYIKPIQRLFKQTSPEQIDLAEISSQLCMELV
ncbi:MAG: hypothetical protein AAGI69_14370 [Cyanobacteria bacterium P01_H01_bin.21]